MAELGGGVRRGLLTLNKKFLEAYYNVYNINIMNVLSYLNILCTHIKYIKKFKTLYSSNHFIRKTMAVNFSANERDILFIKISVWSCGYCVNIFYFILIT